MKRILLLAAFTLLVTGCAGKAPTIKSCSGANGKDVKIKYGDSKIDVSHKVTVKPDEKIVLLLIPDRQSDENVDYVNLDIELIGKRTADQWINRTLNSTDNNTAKAVICVDGQSEGTYKYMVVVPRVGEIDPRIDVKK